MKGVRNTILTVLIAGSCFGGFMLFQFACIDFFTYIHWQPKPSMLEGGIGNAETYAYYVMMACIFPAVMEELIFRFGVFGICRNFVKRVWLAVIISAAIFAVYHWNFGQLVYQFIMGVIFACIYFRTGNIVYPMLAHFINNFIIITYTFIAGSDILDYNWNFTSVTVMIMLSLLAGAVIMRLMQSFEKENHVGIKKWR